MSKSIQFFYDVISPYSWLAFEVLSRYSSKWPAVEITLKPFFLGGIMRGSDNRAPGVVPAKARYMLHELKHLAKYYNVPINIPQDPANAMFVKGSLQAMRFVTAVDMKRPDKTGDVSREFWKRMWSKDEDITEIDSLREAGVAAGLSYDVVQDALDSIKTPEVKERLKSITQEALDQGAFGSPTIITNVDGKSNLFFGSDRYPLIASVIGEEWYGPLAEHAKL